MLLEISLASFLVQKMGTAGASILFASSMLLLAVFASWIVMRTMKKMDNRKGIRCNAEE
jgi:hypothetical protein